MTTLTLPRYTLPAPRTLAAAICTHLGVPLSYETQPITRKLVIDLRHVPMTDVEAAAVLYLDPHGIEWEARP